MVGNTNHKVEDGFNIVTIATVLSASTSVTGISYLFVFILYIS
jgi:hypothetical protein